MATTSEDIDEGLYSRQLYVLGMDAQRRMSCSSVLIYGLTGLGVEIAKNLILAGVKQVSIYDKETVAPQDLSSNFFLSQNDIGKCSRQDAVFPKLKTLNPQVQVVLVEDENKLSDWITQVQVAVLVQQNWSTQVAWNGTCRQHNVKFISCDSRGVFGQVFVDFGDSFTVLDTTGEEPKSAMISYVSRSNPGCVTCLEESRHDLETGDYVVFSQVEGMTELNDGKPRPITVTGPFTFTIEDTSNYHEYVRGGVVTQVKMPQTLEFQPLWEAWKAPKFVLSDFAKEDRMELLHYCFRALDDFISEYHRVPTSGCKDDYALFMEKLSRYSKDTTSGFVVEAFSKTCRGDISPMAAFLGGIVAQEAMKAISGKFTPIQQFFYFDCLEVLGNTIATKEDMQPQNSRYDGQIAVFGKHFQQQLEQLKYFVVGAGAIGCEMLKNWSLMGIGCSPQGKIFVTDMDNIERSNLSRQLLFRTEDIGKPKSIAAAQAVQQINPDVHIEAFEARVGAETEDIFDDDFWESLSGVANALDNVQARQYVDWRCTYYRKSLLESGTLGTKGNTQVIIPGLTETYSASRDPPEKAIPICTLKNFPYQIEHTIQWARDTFEGYFKSAAEDVNQYLSRPDFVESLRSQGTSTLSNTLETLYDSLVVNRPCSFEDCITWARFRFEDLFSNTIKQLLYSFPADMVDKNGVAFWSGTKRPPHPIQFDPSNPTHLEFIMTASNLRAQNYGLKGSNDPQYFQQVLSQIMVPEFQPKANVKIATTDAEAQEQETEGDEQRIEHILQSLPAPAELAGFRLYPIEFDKDDESGLHLGFVTSCSNLRATNYNITNADKYKTKLIAGRIVPAIATTTAVITGLVCMELYKLLQYGYLNMQMEDAQNTWFVKKTKEELSALQKQDEKKVAVFKNGFVNLALPFFGFSEPILAPKVPIGDSGVYFTQFWDRFDINEGRDVTLKEFLDIFKQRFHLEISMMSYNVSIIYSSFIAPKKLEERLHLPLKKVIESVGKVNVSPKQKYLTFEMCCNDEQGEDVEVPYCRYRFRFP